MNKVVSFLQSTRLELLKVVWPKKQEVIRLTMIVIVFSGIVGGYLGALDFGFTKLLEFLVAK